MSLVCYDVTPAERISETRQIITDDGLDGSSQHEPCGDGGPACVLFAEISVTFINDDVALSAGYAPKAGAGSGKPCRVS